MLPQTWANVTANSHVLATCRFGNAFAHTGEAHEDELRSGGESWKPPHTQPTTICQTYLTAWESCRFSSASLDAGSCRRRASVSCCLRCSRTPSEPTCDIAIPAWPRAITKS